MLPARTDSGHAGRDHGRADADAGRARKELGAQVLGVLLAQEREPDGGVGAPGHLDLELGQPEDAAQERLDDVDGLDPVQARGALLPEGEVGLAEAGGPIPLPNRNPVR